MRSSRRLFASASLALRPLGLLAALSGAAFAQDVVTVPDFLADRSTGVVRVPVYVRDVLGTPFGRDQVPGRRISDVAFNVVYGPRACADTVFPFFDPSSGVLAGVDAFMVASPRVPHVSQGFVFASVDRNGLPFVSDVAPGDKLGEIVFSLDGCGTDAIPLTLDELGTALCGIDTDAGERVPVTLVSGTLVPPGGSIPLGTPTPSPTPVTDRGQQNAAASIPALDGASLAALALALAVAGLLLARRAA